MVETRGQGLRNRMAVLAIVGVALLVGCAGGSDDATDARSDQPLGVVPADDADDGADAVDDAGEVDEPEPAPAPDGDVGSDAAIDDASPDGDGSTGGGSSDGGGPDLAELREAALGFFEASERTCAEHAEAVGNPPIDPDHFAGAQVVEVHPGDPDLVVIEDGVGVELFVVPDRDEVWGGPDPDAVMPRPYGFGCPPEVYVGAADH